MKANFHVLFRLVHCDLAGFHFIPQQIKYSATLPTRVKGSQSSE